MKALRHITGWGLFAALALTACSEGEGDSRGEGELPDAGGDAAAAKGPTLADFAGDWRTECVASSGVVDDLPPASSRACARIDGANKSMTLLSFLGSLSCEAGGEVSVQRIEGLEVKLTLEGPSSAFPGGANVKVETVAAPPALAGFAAPPYTVFIKDSDGSLRYALADDAGGACDGSTPEKRACGTQPIRGGWIRMLPGACD